VLRQNALFTLMMCCSAFMMMMPSDEASNTLAHSSRRCSITLSTLMGVNAVSTASCPWNCRRRADSTAHEGSAPPFQRTSNSSTTPWSASRWKKRARTPASRPTAQGPAAGR
jgi:hypothetical protein